MIDWLIHSKCLFSEILTRPQLRTRFLDIHIFIVWCLYPPENYAIIGRDKILSLILWRAIIWTNVSLLLIWPMRTNVCDIWYTTIFEQEN